MKNLKITLALIACTALNYSYAQAPSPYADSTLNLQLSVVYNSNMTSQVPVAQNILFVVDSTNAQAISAVSNNNSNTEVMDPAVTVYPFSTLSSGTAPREVEFYNGLNQFYSINVGFYTFAPATISITTTFTTVTTGNYCAYLKRISTSQVFPILNDTVTMIVPVSTDFSTDFVLLIGPKIVKNANNQTCYGDGLGGVRIICQSSNWGYKIYNSTNNLIRQHSSFTNDTTITNLQQGDYKVAIRVNNIVVDSGSFVVTSPAQIVSNFTISDYAPLVNATVNFTNNSSAATSYTWDFGDGFTDNATNTSHSYTSVGTYVVTLTAINSTCSSTSTGSLTVMPPPMAPPNHMQDPRNSTQPDATNTMRDEMHSEINVATDMHKIIISTENETGALKIEVMNLNGQLISSTNSNSNKVETEVEIGGIYLVRVVFTNGEVITKRIAVI